MSRFSVIFNSLFEEENKVVELIKIPEELKKTPAGLYRSALQLESSDPAVVKRYFESGKERQFGSFSLVFAVRRAKDLLLEGCDYQGLSLELEVNGRRLPQLPAASELEKLFSGDGRIVYVNGNPYKPLTEVFGFQQVYDDSVKCIDTLKKLGIPQETIAIFATPEEICVEVHPGVIGLDGSEELHEFYYRFLCAVAEVREIDGKPVKTNVKTIILTCNEPGYQILVPGSLHPELHRTKVGVGPSHFAYGVAAFSDFCAKKRSPQECIQECLNWLKFMQTQLPPIAGLKERIASLPPLVRPGKRIGKGGEVKIQAHSGRFQPLAAELAGAGECYQELPPALASISAGLDKCLGGGWAKGGLHLLVGPNGSGKSSFFVQQALKTIKESVVLYVSFEQSLREFSLKAAVSGSTLNLVDLLGAMPGTDGAEARKVMAGAVERLRAALPETFFFSGVETARSEFNVEEMVELARMLPDSGHKVLFIESLNSEILGEKASEKLLALKQAAINERFTVFISCHREFEPLKRPHFIEGSDQILLENFQRFSDSLLVMNSERMNLRRFVAMIKGQIDAQLVGKLEQKALQLAGGKRSKNDSYSFLRLIHSRNGRKELLLFLFQPDYVRFFEVANLQLSRG